MCNSYEQHVTWTDYRDAMEQAALKIPEHQGEADLPQADDIRISDLGPVMRAAGDEVTLTQMAFGMPPKGKGGPVFNFRSEGRSFAESRRCLIPTSGFFEFTGKKSPKAKHRFWLSGSAVTAIAGLWREGAGNQPPAFAMLTTQPGPDIAPYHDRQVVVLKPEDWAHWLDLTKSETDLLNPLPAGALSVETVRPGSD